MATGPKGDPTPSRFVPAVFTRWFANRGAAPLTRLPGQEPQTPPLASPDDWQDWLSDPVSLAALTGSVNRPLRSRQQVYEKWQAMTADPIISSALALHVTAALGGHESRGEMVFIEPAADTKGGDAKMTKMVEELQADLQPIFNAIAPTVCTNAVTFGDGYGRMYAEPGVGVRAVYVDELVLPPMLQPYERANATIGYTVVTGSKFTDRLTILQVARMKMPRLRYVPQSRAIEKAIRVTLTTDRLEDLPAVPSLAGGSFLDGAEIAYEKFSAAWNGLVGQRVQDSIDETMVSVAQTGMNPTQREKLKASLSRMFERSNAYIRSVVESGQAVFGRIVHFIPTSGEKQITEIRGPAGTGRTSSLTIEDVMMHARMLAGSLGMDLSMLGFADQLAGGLGEGGFFRVSAQSAEKSRAIRAALTEFFDQIIAVHILYKYRIDLTGKPKPWQINYFSGISALETEKAKTKADNMNSGALLVQTLAQLKDLGMDKAAVQHLLETELGMDADAALKYATALEKAAKDAKAAEAAANGGGGPFGGGGPGGDGGLMPGGPAEGDPIVPAEG